MKSDILNYRRISEELGLHATTIQRSGKNNKYTPLLYPLYEANDRFLKLCEVHRLYELKQPIPANLREVWMDYARCMGILPAIAGKDRHALFAKFGDKITFEQTCDALDAGMLIELWKYDNKYTVRIKDGGTISGSTVIPQNDSFIYCGDVSAQDILEFKKLWL